MINLTYRYVAWGHGGAVIVGDEPDGPVKQPVPDPGRQQRAPDPGRQEPAPDPGRQSVPDPGPP
jgi:hypothetical protein